MKKLMFSASALVLLAACGGGSTGDDVAGNVADAGSAAVESAEDALAALGNITLRGGDASKAEEALAAMSLTSSGDGRVAFESRDVDGATARFENVSITIPGEEVDETIVGDEDGPQLDLETDFDGGVMSIGVVEFEGLDVTDAGATFSRMTFDGIEIVPNDPEEAEQTDFNVGQFELLNPSPEMAAWVASLMGNGAPAPFPAGDALSFDKMSASDLSFVGDDPDDGTSADMSIASIDFGSAGQNRLGVAALKGLSVDVDDPNEDATFNLRLGSISVAGAQTGIINALSEAAEADVDEDEAAAAILGQLYANPVDPGFDRFELSDLAFEGEGVNFSLPTLDSFVNRRADGEPVGFVTEPYNITLSADPEGGEAGSELAGALGMIGFETIELTGKGKASYDPDADRLTLAAGDNTLELKDGFSMKFGGDFGGYKAYGAALQNLDFAEMAEGGEPDPAFMQDALSALALHGLEIEIDDNSMVDRIFNLVAAQSGEDPQAVRNQAVGMIGMAPMMAGGMGIDMNIVTEATTALTAFLQSPGTLSIKLDPEAPLSAETFAAMEDPSALTKETLGFSMSHSD